MYLVKQRAGYSMEVNRGNGPSRMCVCVCEGGGVHGAKNLSWKTGFIGHYKLFSADLTLSFKEMKKTK